FFFSSRRRHTSFSRDWSSDVCSSDLGGGLDHLAHHTLDLRKLVHERHFVVETASRIDNQNIRLTCNSGLYGIKCHRCRISTLTRSEERRVGEERRERG